MLTVINAGFMALVLILHMYRFSRGPAYWLSNAAAFLALCQTIINAALIAQVYQNISDGFIVASEYIIFRYAVFTALAVVSVLLATVKRRELRKSVVSGQESVIRERGLRKSVVYQRAVNAVNGCQRPGGSDSVRSTLHPAPEQRVSLSTLIPGVAAVASFLTLPFMETWTGSAFPAAFSTALAILLVGSIWLIVKIRRELSTSISGLSVKQAMDSLGAAIIFYRKNGRILMQNNKMQELMLHTSGRVFYNGRVYLEAIRNDELGMRNEFFVRIADADTPHSSIHTPNSSFLTPNSRESVWLFTVCDIQADRRTVTRITATDVTEQDNAALILKDRNDELEARRQRLKTLVENIEETCRSEELLRVKTEIHNAQNQKLIMLLQYLRYGELPDSTSFESLKDSILHDTYAKVDTTADPRVMLNIIISQHESMGIKIHINGNLPLENDIALVFVQIVQEAAANSVKHGYASEVHVRIMDNDDNYTMHINDNGTRIMTNTKEGSGIAGMRRQLAKVDGMLSIASTPGFTLTAVVPAAQL